MCDFSLIEFDKHGNLCFWNAQGKLHRENGPAVIYPDGSELWFLNNLQHRENGPAVERPNGFRSWHVNGKLHREDGPAVEFPDGRVQWRLNDVSLTESEFRFQTEHLSIDQKPIDRQHSASALDSALTREKVPRHQLARP